MVATCLSPTTAFRFHSVSHSFIAKSIPSIKIINITEFEISDKNFLLPRAALFEGLTLQ